MVLLELELRSICSKVRNKCHPPPNLPNGKVIFQCLLVIILSNFNCKNVEFGGLQNDIACNLPSQQQPTLVVAIEETVASTRKDSYSANAVSADYRSTSTVNIFEAFQVLVT